MNEWLLGIALASGPTIGLALHFWGRRRERRLRADLRFADHIWRHIDKPRRIRRKADPRIQRRRTIT